jgi:hypothetical protein
MFVKNIRFSFFGLMAAYLCRTSYHVADVARLTANQTTCRAKMRRCDP